MRAAMLALFLASPALAEVTRLGEGYQLVAAGDRIEVRKGKRRATLVAGAQPESVRFSRRMVSFTAAAECSSSEHQLSFDQLEARLVNAEALGLHLRRDWAAAASGFARAAQLDPTWRLPAYNLASARTQLGDVAGALAALAPWLGREPVATYVQVSLDPELRPLLAAPELAGLRAKRPGTLTLDAGIFFAAERGLVGVVVPEAGYLGCNAGAAVLLHDAGSGAVAATIPLSDCKRRKKAAAEEHRTRQRALAETLLSDLGFVAAATEHAGTQTRSDDKEVARLPRAGLGAVRNAAGGVNVLRDGKPVARTQGAVHERWNGVTWIADARVMLVESYRPSDLCAETSFDVVPVPGE